MKAVDERKGLGVERKGLGVEDAKTSDVDLKIEPLDLRTMICVLRAASLLWLWLLEKEEASQGGCGGRLGASSYAIQTQRDGELE